MDEIKHKFMDWKQQLNLKKQPMIPAMGFSEHFIQNVTEVTRTQNNRGVGDQSSATPAPSDDTDGKIDSQKSDQEILESIEDIYFDISAEPATYELEKVCSQHELDSMDETIAKLRKQLKVLSKQMLQNILEKRSACNAEFAEILEVQKKLEESLWTCRKARSYLNYAKTNLTTTSLEILASYRKREILQAVLNTLNAIKKLKTTDVEVQDLLAEGDYSAAISLLIKCKSCAAEYMEYDCVQSLNKQLLEHEFQTQYLMDTVLNEMILNFDARTYAKLMEAYKLLNKSLIAMDQLHINFISTIHSTVNAVLRSYNDPDSNGDDNTKLLYEQMCVQVKPEQIIPCLVSLCKITWTQLASYYQIVVWHQNYKLYPLDSADSPDVDIQEKLKKGQTRIWNDVMSKICIFLQSTKLTNLKYDQFIQALSIAQRLKKVGAEFCGAQSEKLIEIMQIKSEEFFQCYHIACLEEICLFLDNESWTIVDTITNILNLPEYRTVRHIKQQRSKASPVTTATAVVPAASLNELPNNNCDDVVSVHSQDGGSSIYGSYGYFLRFSEKSSPFDGGLDSTMLEEDILSGILPLDEASCYFSEESGDEEQKSLSNKDEESVSNTKPFMVNNTTLNVFRCIGRYLQMCKLLHSISPKIVGSMFELLDFYAYAVHEIFAKDAPVQSEKFHTSKLRQKLRELEHNVLVNIKIWPLNFSSLKNNELANPDTLYGLSQRVVAVESCHDMLQQFSTLQSYLHHLLPANERTMLTSYLRDTDYVNNIRQLVYNSVTSRVVDFTSILNMMSKVKWDLNQVSYQHSSYIDIVNRNIQNFAMQLEDIGKTIELPLNHIWNSIAHVVTHLLVEGFSNVKKCSPGGRALMQLDFTNLMSFLELLSNQKFPDYRSYADTFIKAFYFSSEQFSAWIEAQMQIDDYSLKQLTNLVHCVCFSDKRVKQKLLNLLENGVPNLNLNTNSNGNDATTTTPHVMYSL